MGHEYDYLVEQASRDGVHRYVVGALAMRRGEVLLLRRRADDFLGGLYELPSGRVEDGETLLQALQREVREETGCSVSSVTTYLGAFDYESKSGTKTRQFNFNVELHATDAIRLTEHDAYVWAGPSAFSSLQISDSVRAVISQAFDHSV